MRYFVERLKKFGGMEGEITKSNLPKINPFKLLKIRKELLERINRIPPYYQMYPGRDRSVPDKKTVLNPRYPKEY